LRFSPPAFSTFSTNALGAALIVSSRSPWWFCGGLEGSALAIVPSLLDSGRAVRANLSLDAGLLDAEAAKAHGLTRSAFLASAAREKIEGRAGSREMPIGTPSARTPRGRHTNKRRA
jgi:hypothetical protein